MEELAATTATAVTGENHAPFSDETIVKCEKIMRQYWSENPDLYHIVQRKKKEAAAPVVRPSAVLNDNIDSTKPHRDIKKEPIRLTELRGPRLRARIQANHREIRQHVLALGADILPRTQAQNRKNPFTTVESEREFRSELVATQIRAWRSLLPQLIRKFSRIPDPRRTKSISHTVTVLMVFGLLAFIFRLTSRREMNRELTGPLIIEHLNTLFPELKTIPHADTLARLLEKINPQNIEAVHISLIKSLIRKKKFRKLLIQGCLPVTLDGTQKLYRNGLLQNPRWCERIVGKPEDGNKQQYIYTIEANITLQNGLTIPLMTEYLHRDNNQLIDLDGKQDSETTAFERLAERLKKYFPRLKIIFFMDAMYATQNVMEILHKNNWEYIIRLPKKKLTDLAEQLNKKKATRQSIPGQPAYRKRKQTFYWENDMTYGYEWQLTIHLAACLEQYKGVDKKTGEIIDCFSEFAWISSIRVTINNAHALFNLGARKKDLIEDSINTEKNRGYEYKHAFSTDWNAMQGFHYLMRLGHAINAISEFTKKLKRYIKELGCLATLKLIKETLFSPWLSLTWYADQALKKEHLQFQLE